MLFVAVCLCEGKERAHASLCCMELVQLSGCMAAPYACLGRLAGLLEEHIYLIRCVSVCHFREQMGAVKAIVLGSVPCLYVQMALSDFIHSCMHVILQHVSASHLCLLEIDNIVQNIFNAHM